MALSLLLVYLCFFMIWTRLFVSATTRTNSPSRHTSSGGFTSTCVPLDFAMQWLVLFPVLELDDSFSDDFDCRSFDDMVSNICVSIESTEQALVTVVAHSVDIFAVLLWNVKEVKHDIFDVVPFRSKECLIFKNCLACHDAISASKLNSFLNIF